MRKLLIFLMFLTGCAGQNWQALQGAYSYENAVRDYGPPDDCERLESGKSCAWTTSIGRNWIDKLILTFDTDNRLISGGERRF